MVRKLVQLLRVRVCLAYLDHTSRVTAADQRPMNAALRLSTLLVRRSWKLAA
jgi:hypothetical protein